MTLDMRARAIEWKDIEREMAMHRSFVLVHTVNILQFIQAEKQIKL